METIEDVLASMRDAGGQEFEYFADRIEEVVKSLEADRDNWRKQALDEDARANAIQSVGDSEKTCKSFHDHTLYSIQYSYDKIRWEDVLDTFCRADDAKEWWMEFKNINSKIYQGCFSRTIKITTKTEVVSEIY